MKTIMLLALVLFASLPALAQDSGALPKLPDALQALVDRGAQARYLGNRHGMDGWITIFQGEEQYYYVTPDGEGFLMGILFDKDGRMATVDQVRALQSQGGAEVLDMLAAEKAVPAQTLAEVMAETDKTLAASSPAERMFADVENSNWIVFGSPSAPAIYAFIDPQCPHCHEFMKDLRSEYIEGGLLQVRVIPVGFRDETLAQAAFLLAAPDAQDRFFRHLEGDASALPAKNDISTQGVQKNLAMMQTWKFDVTPMLAYRSRTGEIKLIRGRPKVMMDVMADLPSP